MITGFIELIILYALLILATSFIFSRLCGRVKFGESVADISKMHLLGEGAVLQCNNLEIKNIGNGFVRISRNDKEYVFNEAQEFEVRKSVVYVDNKKINI